MCGADPLSLSHELQKSGDSKAGCDIGWYSRFLMYTISFSNTIDAKLNYHETFTTNEMRTHGERTQFAPSESYIPKLHSVLPPKIP